MVNYYIEVVNQVDIITRKINRNGRLEYNLFNTPYTSIGGIDQSSEIKNTCPELEKLPRKLKKTLDKIE